MDMVKLDHLDMPASRWGVYRAPLTDIDGYVQAPGLSTVLRTVFVAEENQVAPLSLRQRN